MSQNIVNQRKKSNMAVNKSYINTNKYIMQAYFNKISNQTNSLLS